MAYDDEGICLITISILSGRISGRGTGRGDSGGGTVGDAYILPFREVSSEKTFTRTSLEICAQGKIEGKTDA